MSKKFNKVGADGYNGARGPIEEAGWRAATGASSGRDAQVVALCAVMLLGALDALWAAIAPDAVKSTELDARWDLSQKRLALAIQLKLTDPDAKVRAAAQIAMEALLPDDGSLSHTVMTYEKEVDFGLKQIDAAAEAHVARALKDAGLVSIFDEAADATRDFSAGLGRAPDQKKTEARSDRERRATRACAATFTLVHAMMSAAIAQTPAGPDQDYLKALLAPLDALADRA